MVSARSVLAAMSSIGRVSRGLKHGDEREWVPRCDRILSGVSVSYTVSRSFSRPYHFLNFTEYLVLTFASTSHNAIPCRVQGRLYRERHRARRAPLWRVHPQVWTVSRGSPSCTLIPRGIGSSRSSRPPRVELSQGQGLSCSVSPYFFNAGLLYSGSLLNATADAYAKILTSSRIPEFDVLFGPAYKGISLAAVTTVALSRDYGRDQTYCYNRKEKKDVSGTSACL